MPINRTPPASPLMTSSNSVCSNELQQIHQCVSTPNLSTIASNVTERKKRKFGCGDQQEEGMITLSAFSIFSKQQENRFEDLLCKMDSIIIQNAELKKSVEVMSSKYDEFLGRISCLESERKEDKKIIQQLEDKIEYLERKSRAAGLEIRNVPKANKETKDQLCNMVVAMGDSLNVKVQHSDIRDIYRVNSKENTSPIVIDLNTVILKDKIIKGVKAFNKSKSKKEKLNTSHIGLKSPLQSVYVSEVLTYKTQRLYYIARQFQKGHGFDFCWTSHGIVYLRKTVDDQQIRINSEADIDKLRNSIN
ncbi:uncharacterized protein LOC113493903 [Trichoplusia ni]|uniref:Uncharacterized protein LOC113493903 n=1 Tax=Trichoplusia ni TaxID=7111 RepID=A0A7E5VHF8_TRINI|nr:uncharacterized protein LOC113493903 [Trichoplusia ni]